MAELGIEIPEGQPGELEGGAAGLRGAAGAMQSAEASLTNAGQVAEWSGQANASYLDAVAQQAQSAALAAAALERGAAALVRAAGVLEEVRADAKAALADARDAQERIERAREAIEDAQARASAAQVALDNADRQIASSSLQGAPDPGAVAARAQASDAFFAAKDDEERARRQLEEAQEDLERARERAREANERWEAESARTASEVESLGQFTSGGAGTIFGTPAPAIGGGSVPGAFPSLLVGAPLSWSEWKSQRGNPLLFTPFGPPGSAALPGTPPLPSTDYESWQDPLARETEMEMLYGGADPATEAFDLPDLEDVDEGTLRVGFFIAAPTAGFSVGPFGGTLSGDKRGFDPQFSPSRTRAYMELDFASDKAYVQVNPSCNEGGIDCTDAKDIASDDIQNFGDFKNEVDIAGDEQDLHVSWELSQSKGVSPVGEVLSGPSIDGDLHVRPLEEGSGRFEVEVEGDDFPSHEIYYDGPSGKTQTMGRFTEEQMWPDGTFKLFPVIE